MLPKIDHIISERKKLSQQYDAALSNIVQRPLMDNKLSYNYGYYPIVFESEKDLLRAVKNLKKKNILGRRYFFPSLNELPYLQKQSSPLSEDISKRVLCLPLYFGLTESEVKTIAECVVKTM
jgi:dTDP-4-amino-4,6-dideoxygalactose transaminase